MSVGNIPGSSSSLPSGLDAVSSPASGAPAAEAAARGGAGASVSMVSGGPGDKKPVGELRSPALPEPAPQTRDSSAASTSFSIVSVMNLMLETAKELKDAGREARHAERDSSMMQSQIAADKTRLAGAMGLVFGVLGGAVNVGVGVHGVKSSYSQATALGGTTQEMRMAGAEMKTASAELDLASAQVEYKQVRDTLDGKVVPPATEAKTLTADERTALETKKGQLETEITQKAARLDACSKNEIDLLKTEKSRADGKLESAQSKQAKADAKAEAKAAKAQAKADKAAGDKAGSADDNAIEMKGIEDDVDLDVDVDATIADTTATTTTAATADTAQPGDAQGKKDGIDALQTRAHELATDLAAKQGAFDANAAVRSDPLGAEALGGAESRLAAAQAKLAPGAEKTGIGAGPIAERYAKASEAFGRESANANVLAARAQATGAIGGGVGEMIAGAGRMAASSFEADASEAQARASADQSAEQENAEYQHSAADLIASALAVYETYSQTQNDLSSRIYQNF